MKKLNSVAIAVSAALMASSAMAVDFNGYMRAGTGISGDSGENVSFEKNKVGRLGNENDIYAEFGFKQEVYNKDGKTFLVDSMIAQGNDGANGWEDGDFNVAQFNVQAKGLIESDKDAVIWAGKRYYQRQDVHLTDLYYWNTSGAGGGLENLSVGAGKLSLAVIQDDGSQRKTVDGGKHKFDDNVNGYTLDARYAGIPLWKNANLEVGVNYHLSNGTKGQDVAVDDGVMFTGVLTQGLEGGFNKTVVQVGNSSYGAQMAALGAGAWFDASGDQNDAKGFRVINAGVISMGTDWEMMHQLLYAKSTDVGHSDKNGFFQGTGDHDIFSAVVRPMYKWNENMRTVFEAGIFTETTANNTDKGGSKYTIAQAWSAGNSFWARPEIRVYGSYFVDSEGESFGGVTKTDTDMSVGIQVEAWW